jgi:hypothetical protein
MIHCLSECLEEESGQNFSVPDPIKNFSRLSFLELTQSANVRAVLLAHDGDRKYLVINTIDSFL